MKYSFVPIAMGRGVGAGEFFNSDENRGPLTLMRFDPHNNSYVLHSFGVT
jgi:hypothetical protein